MAKTYLDTMMENKEFKELFGKEYKGLSTREEYRKFYIAKFKKMLKETEEQYKNDPQGLKLFTMGYKEMINKLENKNKI